MLLTSGEIEVEDEDAGVAESAWGEEDGEDVTMGLGVDWLLCGRMCGNECGRDECDCSCPAITLVRVDGKPGGEDGVECVSVVVMEMGFLYEYDVRDEGEGENVGSDTVMACVAVVCIVVCRDTVRVVCRCAGWVWMWWGLGE
jgi:hypothetical protein